MREPGVKEKGARKTLPLKFVRKEKLAKPDWIRVKAPGPGSRYHEVKRILREQRLHTVCEEASCPNIAECFGHGTATFMILGALCTRRCPFCDVAHGRPLAPDADEPRHLAETVAALGLAYVVVTSVDRDDLRDGGAAHFVECIDSIRKTSPRTTIEILVPDFRGRLERALEILAAAPPDVMNHNLETVPRLYRHARPGGDYRHSLELLSSFGKKHPGVPTKSGLMVGLGETDEEILAVMRDLRAHGVAMLTIGQYLAPSRDHLPVERYVTPGKFAEFEAAARSMGFRHAAIGPLVRSSDHADQPARRAGSGELWCTTLLSLTAVTPATVWAALSALAFWLWSRTKPESSTSPARVSTLTSSDLRSGSLSSAAFTLAVIRLSSTYLPAAMRSWIASALMNSAWSSLPSLLSSASLNALP
jgi:lipoic acid synthetase